jgi:hypothetical protein
MTIDELVVEEIRGLGADMAREMGTHHYLYFKTEASALEAAAHLRGRGFEASAFQIDADTDWCVCASQELVVVASNMGLIRSAMERVAGQFGGRYDGWEAAIHLDSLECPLCDELR